MADLAFQQPESSNKREMTLLVTGFQPSLQLDNIFHFTRFTISQVHVCCLSSNPGAGRHLILNIARACIACIFLKLKRPGMTKSETPRVLFFANSASRHRPIICIGRSIYTVFNSLSHFDILHTERPSLCQGWHLLVCEQQYGHGKGGDEGRSRKN